MVAKHTKYDPCCMVYLPTLIIDPIKIYYSIHLGKCTVRLMQINLGAVFLQGPRGAKSQWAQGLWHVRVVWAACIPSHQRSGRRKKKTHTQPEMPKRMFRCYIHHHISYVCLCTCTKIPCLFMKWIRILGNAVPRKNHTAKNQQNHWSVRSKFSSSNPGTWNLTLYILYSMIVYIIWLFRLDFFKSRFHDLG